MMKLEKTKKPRTRLERINQKEEDVKLKKANEVLEFMALDAYATWYRKDVSANLKREQKEAIMHKISDMTLEAPIWMDRETNFIEQFPDLKPYSHTGTISGLQLCSVMQAIFNELHNLPCQHTSHGDM